MKKYAAVLLALVCASCATTPDQTAEPREEKVYRTGSNLPVRDPNAKSNVVIVDPAQIQGAASGSSRSLPAGVKP